MTSGSLPRRRRSLLLELLEHRLAPAITTTLNVPLNSLLDKFGDQVVTVQAYQDASRTAFGIFDTGASPITFSDADQDIFESKGLPIPVVNPNGASAQGIGGLVIGDLSKPGTILADGLHAAHMTIDPSGTPQFSVAFGPNSASVPGIQAIIGTDSSESLPTITGTSILKPTPSHPHGLAARINMPGVTLDFSSIVPGLTITLPDLHFVDAGTPLASSPGIATDPVTIPLSLPGSPNSGGPAGPYPFQGDVTVIKNPITLTQQKFLFDTGAQVTVISTAEARALGLDLLHPPTTVSVGGVGGSENAPGYILDEIDVPRSDGGILRFTQVPVYVLDVAQGVDGILGMNLFNTAGSVQYDPYNPAGPSISVTFLTSPTRSNPSPTTVASIHQFLPFGNSIQGSNLPALSINPGQISGEVFYDYNRNGVVDPREAGIPGQTVYLDGNDNGQLDPGELATTTDASGSYEFTDLLPGAYTVREMPDARTIVVSPPGGSIGVTVQSSATTAGVNFGDMAAMAGPRGTIATVVADIYGDLLDRAPDVGGLDAWMQLLQQGWSSDQVARGIWESSEHRALQVEGYYQSYLHRKGDPVGLASWVNAFAAGATETDIQLAFIGSTEYQAAHPDNASFVTALYHDVLRRDPDSGGLAAWQHALQTGLTRAQAARQILNSRERYLLVLDGYYQTLLHRPADWPGEFTWLTLIQQGSQTLDGVAEAFLASNEYAVGAQTGPVA